jgi:UDP-glucose 4-epimerase
MEILIIGSDSFIAQNFISYIGVKSLKGISRTVAKKSNEIVINDFFNIDGSEFSDTDIVFNFAGIVHRPEIKDLNLYDEVNYKLALLNAQKAKNAGVKLFIQMSTIAVYGNSSEISIKSKYNPQSSYGKSKLRADMELLDMQDDNFKVAIVRPPMVYGGGMAPGNMMRLIKLANKGIPLPFTGIDNKRDFINVNNLVQYLEIIAKSHLNGIHLISDHQPVSTEFLIRTISQYLCKKVPMIKMPAIGLKMLKRLRPNDYEKLFGTSHIETNFPFEDRIRRYSVEEGICEMVKMFLSCPATM